VVSGMGMVSSLGLDAKTCCAAARAGVSRASEFTTFLVREPARGEVQPVICHQVPFLAQGFETTGRLLRLMQGALTDLQRSLGAPLQSGELAFYLSVPDPERLLQGMALIPEEFPYDAEPQTVDPDDGPAEDSVEGEEEIEDEESAEVEGNARERAQDPVDGEGDEPNFHDVVSGMLAQAVGLSGWKVLPKLRAITTTGTTGWAEALAAASGDLASKQVRYAVVGGVDSWLDEDTLTWLQETGRLKSPSAPAGLPPGEAAAFLLLQRGEDASEQVGGMSVAGVSIAEETSGGLLSGEPATGKLLRDLLLQANELANWEGTSQPWILCDQNGEMYRAMEWGCAQTSAISQCEALKNSALWYPAASFGDTGAASGAVAACMALEAFRRNYAVADAAVVLSSADMRQRSAVVLQRRV